MNSVDLSKSSPMMDQWRACKEEAKDALLFFRMGDFYEAFYDDAVLLSRELGLTLTKRQEIPMSGVPFHTSDTYVDRLVAKGYRVAIAEQIEDPKKAKGLVKREVVRIVTPGTVVNSQLLSEKTNNFFASVTQVGTLFGLAFLDLTTAEFWVSECSGIQEISNELHRIRPSEILCSRRFEGAHAALFTDLQHAHKCLLTVQEDWRFEHELTATFLTQHFSVHTLDGFGLKGMVAAINAAGGLLAYLQDHLSLSVAHIQEIQCYSTAHHMLLDKTTQKNLEIVTSLHEGGRKHTLLEVLDHTHTPMGARLLRQWLLQPLLSAQKIADRQQAVSALVVSQYILEASEGLLTPIRDLERLIMKVSMGHASPRDLLALRCSCEAVPAVKSTFGSVSAQSPLLHYYVGHLEDLTALTMLIAEAIADDPPLRLSDGKVIREGYCAELDALRNISRDSKSWMIDYQTRLREDTGIKTLKVGFTRMFGYYIEVSKGAAAKMPDTFIRRQTLVNAERYITPELKEYEEKVVTAEEKILTLESDLFAYVREQVMQYTPRVLQMAHALAHLDVFTSLAFVAQQRGYVRPYVDDSRTLHIVAGRHPVIEAAHLSEAFVPNDTLLDDSENRLFVITGPNMAGKSTYIRQVALLTVMAQVGSFIPAKEAHIGVVDKLFTRIGASDDLSRGQSTFMVEMAEAANILHNATEHSLVILDEIGRGTSTYDGISIAWSIAEYMLTDKRCKTLFATHYWELTKLEEMVPGAVNYHIAVQEHRDQIVFLRTIVKGGTDKSYGIHVGRLAGLPMTVIARAHEVLAQLEENGNRKGSFIPLPSTRKPAKPKSKRPSDDAQFLIPFDI